MPTKQKLPTHTPSSICWLSQLNSLHLTEQKKTSIHQATYSWDTHQYYNHFQPQLLLLQCLLHQQPHLLTNHQDILNFVLLTIVKNIIIVNCFTRRFFCWDWHNMQWRIHNCSPWQIRALHGMDRPGILQYHHSTHPMTNSTNPHSVPYSTPGVPFVSVAQWP